MSSAKSSSDNIELHFCQACGVSVPQAAVDSGRATCEPDACAWRLHPESCPIDFGQRMAQTPSTEPARNGGGGRVLMLLALLYVVGATTFLLARELSRKPVVVDLQDTARASDVAALATKVGRTESGMHDGLNDLRANDQQQQKRQADLDKKVTALGKSVTDVATGLRAKDDALAEAIVDIGDRTGVLKGTADEALREIRKLAELMRNAPKAAPPTTNGTETVKKDSEPKKSPGKSDQQLEEERLMSDYIAKLKDRRATEQTRYNAAVQLGDLRYKASLDALIEALEKDPHDLVRRAAAWSIGLHGKASIRAIPTLIAQIGGKHEYVGYMCERALGEITKAIYGEPVSFNFDPTMSRNQRKKVEKQWVEWWKKVQPKLMPE